MSAAAGDGGRLARLTARFDTPAAAGPVAQKWEDRHVRITVWIDRDLRDELWARADGLGLSRRQVVDEMARAWLTDHAKPH